MSNLLPLAAAVVAILILPGWSFSYDVIPKVVVVLLGAAAALVKVGQAVSPAKPLTFLICAQIATTVLAALFSTHPQLSWLGGTWRRSGVIAEAAVLLLGLAFVAVPRERILRITVIGALPVALYGNPPVLRNRSADRLRAISRRRRRIPDRAPALDARSCRLLRHVSPLSDFRGRGVGAQRTFPPVEDHRPCDLWRLDARARSQRHARGAAGADRRGDLRRHPRPQRELEMVRRRGRTTRVSSLRFTSRPPAKNCARGCIGQPKTASAAHDRCFGSIRCACRDSICWSASDRRRSRGNFRATNPSPSPPRIRISITSRRTTSFSTRWCRKACLGCFR